MTDKLRPGGMGLKDPGGTNGPKPGDFVNSMAEAMENALNQLLAKEPMDKLPVDNNSDESRNRRRLFVAIAQGVVRHLHDHQDALEIHDAADKPTGLKISIQTDGTLL
jgi:hypothetical protein